LNTLERHQPKSMVSGSMEVSNRDKSVGGTGKPVTLLSEADDDAWRRSINHLLLTRLAG